MAFLVSITISKDKRSFGLDLLLSDFLFLNGKLAKYLEIGVKLSERGCYPLCLFIVFVAKGRDFFHKIMNFETPGSNSPSEEKGEVKKEAFLSDFMDMDQDYEVTFRPDITIDGLKQAEEILRGVIGDINRNGEADKKALEAIEVKLEEMRKERDDKKE